MRFLTPFGKITILKTIIIPKFNHVFISIPNPDGGFIKKLNDIFYKFIWDNKPDKISGKQLANGYLEGGLKMPSILLFIKGLKVSWLRRLHQNSEIPWVQLANHFLGDPCKSLLFGSQWSLKISQDIGNQFWRDTLLAWNDTIKTIPGNMYGYEKWHGPLWYNTNIEKVINFLPQFYKNGILCPIDLITDKGQFMTKDQVTESYNLQVDFLSYHRLISSLKLYVEDCKNQSKFQRPYFHNHMKLLLKSKKGAQDFYETLKSNIAIEEPHALHKWKKDINISIDHSSWRRIHKNYFYTIQDKTLIWFQYKIIYRLTGTNSLLYKMKLTDSQLCNFCNIKEETIYHLFIGCEKTSKFWKTIGTWLMEKGNINFDLSPSILLFGNWHLEQGQDRNNIISILAKRYIFKCSKKKQELNILQYQNYMIKIYTEQKYLAQIETRYENLKKLWSVFTLLTGNEETTDE